ncbi:SIMPL domain-containing protein [Borreliella valaisiana]|uniref:SIMPL domain-containing protein n=1 Tax=Borreliella valaisiana TaxID=62088 RepID=UPI002ED4179B|nr:SIMPL domain-containing protein [Borreliella valaisiana]WVN13964.1 SIMPL domain-containing protein [Borreliella valaisiana]
MFGRKDLFFLLFFLALSIIISYIIKNVSTKNGNYITVKRISGKEIFLTSLSWNLQYDLDVDTVGGSIKVNNLNLSNKIKNFFIKWGFNEDHIINRIYV